MAESPKKHLVLQPEYFSNRKDYLYSGGLPRKKPVPAQDRSSHFEKLNTQISALNQDMAAAIAIQKQSNVIMDYGLLVEFESFDGIGEIFEGASITKNSELRNIRQENGKTYATVFIPDGELPKLERKIHDYINYKIKRNGNANDYQPLIDTIKNFKKATVKALWTDTIPLPVSDDEMLCWEVWLTVRNEREQQRKTFVQHAKNMEIEVSEQYIQFRDRTVLLIRASKSQIEQSIELLNNIAELRKAKTTADFFRELSNEEQKKWLDDLLPKINYLNNQDTIPYICILDTGVNNAHPLLKNSLTSNDLFTINEAWGKDDKVGHGTPVAGLALFGDLTDALESTDKIEVNHRLESSKIINSSQYVPAAKQPLDLYAEYTHQAILQAEIANLQRKRVFQLAITTTDARDKGRPSSWSAALDMMAYGSSDTDSSRLFIVSAGNADISQTSDKYPTLNMKEGVRDPAQSWNVLTVGAYSEKDRLSADETIDANSPTASHGELSPYSTTSYSWEKVWPYKPDIVMEGGNTASNKYGQVQADSLSLLTTNHNISKKLFTTIYATSAASALASKMCAHIMTAYPELRPETIRALMVHSALWTPAMLKQFDCEQAQTKGDYINLVRICGFGVPNVMRALSSFNNDFTMIIEDTIQPYKHEKNRKNRDMKFYDLPFPRAELESLGNANVEMRVTLSYFIEPNPSSRGRSEYSYKSHGLRFDVKSPTETDEHFMGRINKNLQEEELEYSSDDNGNRWVLGKNSRTKGSLHSDIWRGSAADLAACNVLAVYPVYGWWKKYDDTVNNTAKYSLLVSIKTSVDTDLITPTEIIIANRIRPTIQIDTRIL